MNLLTNLWSVDVVSLLLLAGLGVVYGYVSDWRLRPGAGLYGAGLLLLGVVQLSPLHTLGRYYLLSAHMAGHMLVLLVCAPLLVLGLPRKPASGAYSLLTAVSVFFQRKPWLGWLIGLVTMWFWHVPSIHDLMIAPSAINGTIPLCALVGPSTSPLVNFLHVLQPISLVLAGVCFVWPILGPLPAYRIHPLTGVAYLFTACVGCSLLGMLITFAPVGTYSMYGGPDYFGIAHQIRTDWGLDRAADQQTSGLLMWVPGCFIYLSGVLYLLMNWLEQQQQVPLVPESRP